LFIFGCKYSSFEIPTKFVFIFISEAEDAVLDILRCVDESKLLFDHLGDFETFVFLVGFGKLLEELLISSLPQGATFVKEVEDAHGVLVD
jgi:hypothetical protein